MAFPRVWKIWKKKIQSTLKYKRDGRCSTYEADVKPNARRLKSQSPKFTWRESTRLNPPSGRESKICSPKDVEKAKKTGLKTAQNPVGFLLVNCWKNYQQNANFGGFWASERSAASGLNTGFARHHSPANRMDTGFGAKCRNKKSRKCLNLRLLKWRDGLCAELDCALLALRVFAPQKSPSSLPIFRHKKTQPLRIAFLKVAGWTRCSRSCVSILITRIYFR